MSDSIPRNPLDPIPSASWYNSSFPVPSASPPCNCVCSHSRSVPRILAPTTFEREAQEKDLPHPPKTFEREAQEPDQGQELYTLFSRVGDALMYA